MLAIETRLWPFKVRVRGRLLRPIATPKLGGGALRRRKRYWLKQVKVDLEVIEGQPPNLGAPPASCPFRDRCTHAFERCARENPTRTVVAPGHDVACFWDAATGGPRDV